MSEIIDNGKENPSYKDWSILEDEGGQPGGAETEPEGLPSPESKERNLTFENLSNLPTEEYIELWRHLNPFYVTHATRQGVRDHAGMMYHTAGTGAFQNGGKKVFKDDKMLRSPAEVTYGLPPDFTEEDVSEVLDELVFSSKDFEGWSPQQILRNLPFNFTLASAKPWADKQAIHFAQHTVLSELYGGESNNEIFFVFPTDVIASQCRFGGHMHRQLTTAQVSSERKWNDLFVWPEDGRIPLDAGLVFLPKSQLVDKNTGSKYATRKVVDEAENVELVPERDESRIVRFREWMAGLSKDSPEMIAINESDDYSLAEEKLREIGIPEEAFSDMLYYGNHYSLLDCAENGHFDNIYDLPEEEQAKMTKEEVLDYSVRNYLASHVADLKLAEDTITAEEYWGQYFSENPDQKPAHIIYYDGDPSTAVRTFLIENGILEEGHGVSFYKHRDDSQKVITGPGDTSDRDGGMLGFDEHYIGDGSQDEHLNAEHRRFNELAIKILKERLDGRDSREQNIPNADD